MDSFWFPLHFFLFFFLHQPFFSAANLHKNNNLLGSDLLSQLTSRIPLNSKPPTPYFEVTRPIKLPKTKPCSYLILQHDFAFTYGKPPVLANYSLPSHCPSQTFSKIILEWKATCKGTQYDRIFGVWLGGVELLRGCTAEPTDAGIIWSVEKDITRYHSLLLKKDIQTLAVSLGNIVDRTYTGVYHVNITFHFYPAEKDSNDHKQISSDVLASWYDSKADLILPFSRNLPINDGLWYEIRSWSDIQFKAFKIPQNAYRAALEIYVSFHENDEFWYANSPNDYIEANNLTGMPGNGPFREVVVSLDGLVAGAVWPFTVIYTGGINPLFWSPITGIGSFNLPSYDIEITPFLGNLLDGKPHKLGFSVTNALNVWFIDANLHLWLDSNSMKTEGKLLKHNSIPLSISSVSNFQGLNGKFFTNATRSISSSGWVKSSFGKIITNSIQEFSFINSMEMGKDMNLQVVSQKINSNQTVSTQFQFSDHYTHVRESFRSFPLSLFFDFSEEGNGNYLSVTKVTLGFNEEIYRGPGFGGLGFFFISSLKDLQNAESVIVVKNYLVVTRFRKTKQVYKYDGSDFCYFRNISSSNNIIVYDKMGNLCDQGADFSRKNLAFLEKQ